MVVLSGSGWSRLDGRLRQHGPSSLVALPPDLPHEYGANPEDPWTIAWVHMTGAAVSFHQAPSHISSRKLLRVAELIDEAYAVVQRQSSDFDHLLVSGIAAHLLSLLRQPNEADDALSQLVHHLRDHLADPIDLPALAQRSGYSVSQFLVRFRQRFGTTPIQWLTTERIAHACRLLGRSDISIEEIAHQCGFGQANSFARAFRQRMGLSPSAYRRAGPPG